MRTDNNNNPAAIITDLARQAGLEYGRDYEAGTPFPPGSGPFVTAKLLGDPVAMTIWIINEVGYFTQHGTPRWTYIAIPKFVWNSLSPEIKRDVIGYHYQHEGGIAMRSLFPNYGKG